MDNIGTIDIQQRAANNIRVLSIAMVEKAQSGHPGGAVGASDFMQILFSEYLRFDPTRPDWFFRDRFFLDPGHMSAMLYSTLSLFGYFSMEDLELFRTFKSPTPGHPEKDIQRGIENVSGPLGQGHVNAVGSAIAERFFAHRFGEWTSHKSVAFISDGGIQEEISQGAGRIAGHLGLHNMIMYYDANNVQLSTSVNEVTTEDVQKKYEAWGWSVLDIDGHDPDQIRYALDVAFNSKEKPTLIIGRTIMGQGIVDGNGDTIVDKVSLHGKPISKAGADLQKTIKSLGGDPENPFLIFEDVQNYYSEIKRRKREKVSEFLRQKSEWEDQNPELSKKLLEFQNEDFTSVDFHSLTIEKNSATRDASGQILAQLGEQIENMMVLSADLSNSDKTDYFLRSTTPISKNDFSGRFVQMGVSELTMAAITNGIAIHGGILPVCATFFVFSDYMKPAVRLASIMELQVVYIWTHDSFRVGEDGPTHQPIEHEAQLRLLEELKNHSGNDALRVLRPADADETIWCWDLAIRNTNSPTALILSRQSIPSLPDSETERRSKIASRSSFGAYIAYKTGNNDPELHLLGNGSEVSTLKEVSDILYSEHNIPSKVISICSQGLFKKQDIHYQKSVLPESAKIFALTAGLPSSYFDLVTDKDHIYGLSHFGYSAPAKVLDEKFGFSPHQVVNWILERI